MNPVSVKPAGLPPQEISSSIRGEVKKKFKEYTKNIVKVCNDNRFMLYLVSKGILPTTMLYIGGPAGYALSAVASVATRGPTKGAIIDIGKNWALSLISAPVAVLTSSLMFYSGFLNLRSQLNAFSILLKDMCELREQDIILDTSIKDEAGIKTLYDVIDNFPNPFAIDDIEFVTEFYYLYKEVIDNIIASQEKFLLGADRARKDILDRIKKGESFHSCFTEEFTSDEIRNIRQSALTIPENNGRFVIYSYFDDSKNLQRGILFTDPNLHENIEIILEKISEMLNELSTSDSDFFSERLVKTLETFTNDEKNIIFKYIFKDDFRNEVIRGNKSPIEPEKLFEEALLKDALDRTAVLKFESDFEEYLKMGKTEVVANFYNMTLKCIKNKEEFNFGVDVTIPDAILISGLNFVPVSGILKSEKSEPVSVNDESRKKPIKKTGPKAQKDYNQYVYTPSVSLKKNKKKSNKDIESPPTTPALTTTSSQTAAKKNTVLISSNIHNLIEKGLILEKKLNLVIEKLEEGRVNSKRTNNFVIFDTIVEGDNRRGKFRVIVSVPNHENNFNKDHPDNPDKTEAYVVLRVEDYHRKKTKKLK